MPKKDPRNYNPQPAKRIADPRMPKKYLKLLQKQEKILAKNKKFNNKDGKEILTNMIKVADLTRKGFVNGDTSTVMSPRTVMHWAENTSIFKECS